MVDDSLPPRRRFESENFNVARLRKPAGDTAREPATVPDSPSLEPALDRPAAQTAKAPRSGRLRRILLSLGPALLVLVGLYFYLSGGRYVSTDNAYVKTDKLSIVSDVPGFIAEIDVKDNEKIAKGQILLKLDDEPFRIALSGADAQLGIIRNEIEALQATYRQNLAQVEQARAELAYFEAQFHRQQALISKQATPQAALEQAQRDQETARERVAVSQRQAESTLAQLGGKPDDKAENNPRYQQAQAQVDKATRDLHRTVLHAPMAGIVTNVANVQLGSYLAAAQPAFDLVVSDHVWVAANPKETDLTYVKEGDPAEITVDAYPGRVWPSVVASISPASGAEFSVLPAQNASGNWVKVVQRVPVRLQVNVSADAPPLRSGMSVEVSIDTGHQRSLGDLVRIARGWAGV
jgi:membrane fusion protein (multidrug efflux system)